MKVSIAIFLTFFLLSFSSYSFSWDCGDPCQNKYCNPCNCADLGVGRNPCISDNKYCEAFGNVGAMGDIDP